MKIGLSCLFAVHASALRVSQGYDPDAWQNHWSDELAFWDGWIANGGGQYSADFNSRMNPSTKYKFADELLRSKQNGQTRFRVLDVGAGPVTFVGYSMPGYDLNIIATDPLADEYAKLWNMHNKKPPVESIAVQAENLTQHFEPNSFDLVTTRNALDHGIDPMQAVKEMVKVVKPGHKAILINYVNEGNVGGYGKMEQWNFMNEDGVLYIWRPEIKHNASDELRGLATVTCDNNNVKWRALMTCELLKH